MQDPKIPKKKSLFGHHRTTLLGHIFATTAYIDNRKKNLLSSNLPHMSSQYGELWPTSGWDRSSSVGHPSKFQWVSCLGIVTAQHSSIGHQPNCAALNRGRHLYSAEQPSRWALAHILVVHVCTNVKYVCVYLSVPRCIPTLLHGPGCNLGEWYGVPSSCALLGGFAIGAQVSLLRQHSAKRELSGNACTRSMPGCYCSSMYKC